MRGRQTTRSGLGPLGLLLVVGAVLLLVGGGTFGTLYALGYLPFRPATVENHDGQLACIVLTRPLTAFSKITRPDLADPKTGGLSVIWIDKDAVDSSMLRQPGDVIGRVLARDKSANYIFSEKDLLPKGSREGVAGGVPTGKLAMSVDPSRIRGLEALRSGDRFDVLAATSLDATSAKGPSTGTPLVVDPTKPLPKAVGPKPKQVAVQVLVTNGSLVTIKDATHKEATIAIDPPEITPLTKALATDDNLFCVVRSGRADAGEGTSVTPDVSCVVLSRTLAAYSRVAPADLVDEKTGQPALLWFAAEDVDAEWLKASSEVIGRVLARDKTAGQLFTDDDFLPAGTREGVAGGVPAGKMAIVVDAARIRGLHVLQFGNRFDLLAGVPVDVQNRLPYLAGGTGNANSERLLATLKKQSTVNVLVQNGSFVTRATSRSEATLAVDPDEVSRLTKALTSGNDIICVARSSLDADDAQTIIAPDDDPLKRITVIETMKGKSRSTELFLQPAIPIAPQPR